MKRLLTILPCFVLLVVAMPAFALPPGDDDGPNGIPNLNGPWYANGDLERPCFITQQPDGRAMFTNDNGSRARGMVDVDRVWIPSWSPGHGIRGLKGKIRGDQIVWPDGNFWSR